MNVCVQSVNESAIGLAVQHAGLVADPVRQQEHGASWEKSWEGEGGLVMQDKPIRNFDVKRSEARRCRLRLAITLPETEYIGVHEHLAAVHFLPQYPQNFTTLPPCSSDRDLLLLEA